MKKNFVHIQLLDFLKKKFPKKKELSVLLFGVLDIEKEAVYRRLRGEVPFSLDEVASIARELGLSLDQMVDPIVNYSSYSTMSTAYTSIEDANYEILVNYVEKIKEVTAAPYSEYAQALNTIPLGICLAYPNILKFLGYEFLHLYGERMKFQSYGEYKQDSRLREEYEQMDYYLKKMTYTYYIWDPVIIQNFVENVKYYVNIKQINQQDVDRIKKDLFDFMDDLERYATDGYFSKGGNRFSLYVSNVHLGATHAYLWSENSCLGIIITFILQAMTITDQVSCSELKTRMGALLKASMLISQTAEKERIVFFRNQRESIEKL